MNIATFSREMYLLLAWNFLDMSKKAKKNAPLPASSAGLLRFFEDETKGIKVKPELILGISGALIAISIAIKILFPV
jgi:preprotein translocase subunit Sec61beta